MRRKPTLFFGSSMIVLIAGLVPVHRQLESTVFARLSEVILVAIVLCSVLGRLRAPKHRGIWLFALVATPLAALIAGTSSEISASLQSGIQIAVIVGLTPFVLTFYLTAVPSLVRKATTTFVAIQTLSAAVGIVQLLGFTVLGSAARDGRANGFAGHPNVLGVMSAIAVLICIASFRSASPRKKYLLTTVGLLNGIAIIGTGSLSSLLALICGLLVLLVSLRMSMRTVLLLGFFASLIVPAAYFAGIDLSHFTSSIETRVNVVTGEVDGVASLGIRQQTYEYAWNYLLTDPIVGSGMDGANQGTFDGVTVVHNYLLRAWYQGGLLYFSVICSVTLALLSTIWRSMRTATNPLPAAAIAAVVAFGATSAFYNQQEYWFILVFAVAVVSIKRDSSKYTHSSSKSLPSPVMNEATKNSASESSLKRDSLFASAVAPRVPSSLPHTRHS